MKITNSVLRDKFELCDPKTGEVVKELPFTVNITATIQAATRKQAEMAVVDSADPEAMGKAFVGLLEAIFGAEVTNGLLEYFEDDYMQMIVDLEPVLTDVIFPAFTQYRSKAIAAKKKVKR